MEFTKTPFRHDFEELNLHGYSNDNHYEGEVRGSRRLPDLMILTQELLKAIASERATITPDMLLTNTFHNPYIARL
ncbi:hypothetical protein [Nostoc sp.]|uniref:hypothetical protein n=1 Tax=Nostoc sp. TaxID=1180 RepID=UPI002FF729BE